MVHTDSLNIYLQQKETNISEIRFYRKRIMMRARKSFQDLFIYLKLDTDLWKFNFQ